MERVGHESISVRLADRRMIDARLPNTPLLSPAKIAAQYNLGDQVQITCKPIQPVWEEDTSRYQFLETDEASVFCGGPRPQNWPPGSNSSHGAKR